LSGCVYLRAQPAFPTRRSSDLAEGDIHPAGNPHIQTDPRNIAAVAAALARRMAEVDPADNAVFAARSQSFTARWNAAMQRWAQRSEEHTLNSSHLGISYAVFCL